MRKNYEDEVLNIKANIALGIFDIFSINALYNTFIQYIHNDFGIEILIIVGSLCLAFIIICSMLIYRNIYCVNLNNKITKEIIENGEKVTGKIVRIKEEYQFDKNSTYFKKANYFRRFKTIRYGANNERADYYYYAIVQYNYNGKKHIVKSPSLNFSPNYLKSKDIDIWVYKDKYYIDNYKINISKLKKDENNCRKIRIIIITMFFSMCLLSGFTIYLNIINILKTEVAIKLFIIYMLLYAVISIGIFFKYLTENK